MSIAANLQRVREQVTAACVRTGRTPDEVKLIAVSKTHPAAAIQEAFEAGQRFFGENRVQEMQAKHGELTSLSGLQVHLIGPLQNNKTGKAAEIFDAVDTLDSERTATRLNAAAGALGKIMPVLVEVKLSHEASKHGVAAEELEPLLASIAAMPHLHLDGLMTVPPLEADGEAARPYFRTLRALRDQHRRQFPSLQELSMGMSGDFEIAIEEGSTTVRVGTAIFGRRETAI